jgi:NAD(P)-dependent dehydrogenase (short-subunit alcohol dehydrogenase family)
MKGKRCLVTGATSGIGKTIAAELAVRGGEVILVSRNAEKCQETAQQIIKLSGNQTISYFQADLSSQEDIRTLTRSIRSNYSSLDVLVNNAGGIFWRKKESVDGYDMNLALNYLNYFLLTNLLLELLTKSPSARIINVSSLVHSLQVLDIDNMLSTNNYIPLAEYAKSKLAIISFTYELSRRLAGTSVTVNAYDPGFTATNIGRESLFGKIAMPVANIFAVPVKKGAETGIYLATSPEVEGISGMYYSRNKPVRSSKISYDEDIASKLWGMSEKLTGLA